MSKELKQLGFNFHSRSSMKKYSIRYRLGRHLQGCRDVVAASEAEAIEIMWSNMLADGTFQARDYERMEKFTFVASVTDVV